MHQRVVKKGVGTSISVLSKLLDPDITGHFAVGTSLPVSFGAKLGAAALAGIHGQRAVIVISRVRIKAVALRALWLGDAGTLIHANKVVGLNLCKSILFFRSDTSSKFSGSASVEI